MVRARFGPARRQRFGTCRCALRSDRPMFQCHLHAYCGQIHAGAQGSYLALPSAPARAVGAAKGIQEATLDGVTKRRPRAGRGKDWGSQLGVVNGRDGRAFGRTIQSIKLSDQTIPLALPVLTVPGRRHGLDGWSSYPPSSGWLAPPNHTLITNGNLAFILFIGPGNSPKFGRTKGSHPRRPSNS